MISFSLYAEDFQIILDPLQGKVSEEDEDAETIRTTKEENRLKKEYTQECTLEEIKAGFSKECNIKDITYILDQCIHEEEIDGRGESSSISCSEEEVTRDAIDELMLQNDPFALLESKPTYSQECSIVSYEDGSYSEYCSPLNKTKSNEEIAESSVEDFDSQEEVNTSEEQFVDETTHQEEVVFPKWLEQAQNGVGKFTIQIGQGANERKQGIGSGFFIKDSNDQPIFITNYHVLGSAIAILFTMNVPSQEWFTETSNIRFYIEQGDHKFRVKGVRSMSLLMDLAVLEVEDYTGATLSVADDYSSEVPVYILGYPGGNDLQKIKGTSSFPTSTLYTSFMVSHNIEFCRTLSGVSGGPALNTDGEVIGVAFSGDLLISCKNLNIIPLEGFNNIDFMSSLKANKESMVDLVREQESMFYNQLLFNDENKKDLTVRAVLYVQNRMLFSNILHPLDDDYLLDIYKTLSDSEQDVDEEGRKSLQFLIQKNITNIKGFDLNRAAELGSVEAQFGLGLQAYITSQFEKALQLFQESIQSRNPLYLYKLSEVYYKEENIFQACRLLTYATEPVEALDDLYQEYECDDVLNEV